MSHQAEQDKQPAETFSQQEGPQSNPTFRWASQQNLVDLSEEQLEGSEVLTLEQLEVIQGGELRRVNSAPAHLGIPRTPPSTPPPSPTSSTGSNSPPPSPSWIEVPLIILGKRRREE